MLKKTLIYRRAVFVKTGQLNELGGYKPRTSGRRTCKFYTQVVQSFLYVVLLLFLDLQICECVFSSSIFGLPGPLWSIYMCTQTHTYTHTRALHRYVHDWLCITLRNVHSLNLLVESFVYILKLNRSLSFCVVKFFHEHFCFTFSYDVFRLFWPPEMTVY